MGSISSHCPQIVFEPGPDGGGGGGGAPLLFFLPYVLRLKGFGAGGLTALEFPLPPGPVGCTLA